MEEKQGYYRVRTAWEDAESQVGRYRLLKSAITKCDETPGTFVFDNDGAIVYPTEVENRDTAKPVMEKSITERDGGYTPHTGKATALLNVRSEPSMEAEIVTVLKRDTLVEILEDCGDWYHIKPGYVSRQFIQTT